MFSRNRVLVGIITLLVMGVTTCLMTWLTRDHGYEFAYTLGALLLGELLLGLGGMGLSKTEGRLLPVMLSHSFINYYYMLFVLVMVVPFALDASELALRVIHVLGLLVVTVLHIIMFMAYRTTAEMEQRQKVALAAKKNFGMEITRFATVKKDWLNADRNLAKKVNDLQEKARYASDTLQGMEEVDCNISVALTKLNNAESPEAALTCIAEIANLFDFRRQLALSLR